MRAPSLAVLLVLPLALAPATATSGAHERNAAYFWSLLGESAAPDAAATMPDGRIVTLAAAVDEAAARAGSVDLAAIASGAAPAGVGANAGDLWVIEIGDGPCDRVVLAPALAPGTPIHPQVWIYAGYYGTISTTHGDTTSVIGWTTKTASTHVATAGFDAVGQTDGFCILFGEKHFAFPFVDGVVHVKE